MLATLLLPVAPLAAQDTAVTRTTFIAAQLTRAAGAVELFIPDTTNIPRQRAVVANITIDGAPRSVSPAVEVVGPRAIAVTWAAADGAEHDFEVQLTGDDGSAYYGTGERFNALNQRAYILPVSTDDRFGYKGVASYKPVPFFMSARGYGVWVDSYSPGTLDLGATDRFTTKLRFHGSRMRVVFFAGPAFADILDAYTSLTGRTRVPPPWAFALWKSRNVHHNRDSVLVDVERLRQYRIPASVLVIDSPWETGYNTFDVNRAQFAEPEKMFARIRELGFELCLWLTPFVNDSNIIDMDGITPVSSNFEAARPYLVKDRSGTVALSRWWKGRGGLVDFTSRNAIDWWHAQLRKTKAYGARAFKVDDGEGNFVPDAVFADGSSAREMKNRYSVLYDSVMQAYVDRELAGDGALIVRSAHNRGQRYPFGWAGDNAASFGFDDGLPNVILAGLNAAMSGIALWGSDIAGYVGRPDKELFIRWTQFGTFSPFMQVHMTSNLGPWDFDAETLAIFRQFATLRVQLFPYINEAAHVAARTGLPVMRPMPLAFQDDANAALYIYQYLFGPDLLVAPMYQQGTHRAVYIPRGKWIEYWNGAVIEGPRVIEAEAALDRMPLFVRAGAILPLLPADVQTLVPRNQAMAASIAAVDDRRVLEVWPADSGRLENVEGLSATATMQFGVTTLSLASERARPLQVIIVGKKLPALHVDGAETQVDGTRNRTIITFRPFKGRREISWEN